MLKADETTGMVLFEEDQKPPQWLLIIIGGIMLFTIISIFFSGLNGIGNRDEMWLGLAIAVPVQVLVMILFQHMQLEKIVTTNGLYYRWKPWQKKYRVIEKESIDKIEVRKGPVFKYGFGWSPFYGRYHNACGGQGIQLRLVNGNRIFFSTFDVAAFQQALQNLISYNPKNSLREF